MARSKSDPLLHWAQALIAILKVFVLLGVLGCATGIVAAVVAPATLLAEVANGAPQSALWPLIALFALAIGVLVLARLFLDKLRGIIASVGAGDPFIPDNAGRLERMGWLALAMDLVALPAGLIAGSLSTAANPLGTQIGFSFPGLILVLVLFILARVFRQGAAMREDLEGTV